MQPTVQSDLFGPASALPDGFRYRPDMLSHDHERALVGHFAELPFTEFQFHGYVGRRRTVSFGWHYDFGQERLLPAQSIPSFLLPLREGAASFGGIAADDLQHVLITEYGPGAAIGWHRDKAAFGEVIGISLLTPCVFRLRQKVGPAWKRVSLTLQPRSAYLLRGPSRTLWEHSIPAVTDKRYSVTFRSLRSV